MEEKIRVQKFIALSGLCSRRNAEDLIKEGKVKVNGEVISIGDQCLKTDKIEVNDEVISFDLDDLVYIVMNKSSGYVTTNADEFGRETIYDFLDEKDKKDNLFSVGRLDMDTSGLLILTNDGHFAQSIIHPSQDIAKEYIVQTEKELRIEDQKKLEEGVMLDEYRLKPLQIRRIGPNKYIARIYEGRKRQIRRMFELLDYEVTNLHRISIGGLDLKEMNLEFKQYAFVTKKFLQDKIFVKYS
ncbi:MAG: pseudouridine synthase [Candidatus Woesearchaeota archaeon]|jgi:23S rRNA pseudouridine2605 synthase|nr:pseudouridine synthase [Candidatus Woesearchaeota archaeon]